MFCFRNKNAFTLIELLVVIAIMGIVASIIYVSINPKEQISKANNSKVKHIVDSLRTPINNYFSTNNYSYYGVENDKRVSEILSSIQGVEIRSTADIWAVKAPLENGKWFCRDSSGNATEKDFQDISDYKCD